MASENPDVLHTFVPNEDLRTNQYHLVEIICWSDRWNGPLVGLCGDGEKMCGVLQNAPNLPGADPGEWAIVMRVGKSKAVIGAAIACARSWASDANGHVVGAVANDWIGGQMHEPGTLSPTPTGGEIATVDVEALNPWKADHAWVDFVGGVQ
jgi:hypothetical protein